MIAGRSPSVAVAVAGILFCLPSCRTAESALHEHIAQVDALPADQRPAEWDRTRALILRKAPEVGQPAPDFTLKRMDNDEVITLRDFRPGEPKVLILASYT